MIRKNSNLATVFNFTLNLTLLVGSRKMNKKQEKQENNSGRKRNNAVVKTEIDSDSESEKELKNSDDKGDGELDLDGVGGDRPFRFICGGEAQALLDGIAYGLDENGQYFLIDKDGDFVSGLLVDAIIRRYIKAGTLLPIASITKPGARKTTT